MDHFDGDDISARRQRKQAKKKAALLKRQQRLQKRGPSTSFVGTHKWLGGAVDPSTGYIYGVPSHSYQIICIKPSTSTSKAEICTIPLPNEFQQGKFKWLRGLVYNGCLYAIPAWSTKGILKLHLATQRVTVLPLPRSPSHYKTAPISRKESDTHGVDRGRWMWHGGAVGESSSGEFAIYCVPSNAQHVLKVYLDGSDKVVEIGPQLSVGQNKWYGGIKGIDGCIYGMPYTATGVLRINPKDDSVDVLGNFPSGGWKWHGGLLAPQTGVIYAFPAHSNEVLCVDTNVRGDINHDESWRVSTIPIKRHEGDTDPHDLRYKWLGGSYGADDCIYGMPSDATTILRIDPFKNEATTFGNVSSSQNKFQGGVLSAVDKCVYAVPADASCVLKIDTNPDTPLSIDFVGKHFQDIDDKWQGAFVGSDNKIYAIPENINNVMIITPTGLGKVPCVEMLTDGETTPRPRIAGATVEYYDNDFSYEEHQMEMEQKLHSTSASLEADDYIVDDDDDERSNLHPNRQAKCWDGFHTAHRSGNFFKPRRYIMKCFPCILSHNASDNSAEMVKSAEKKRLVLEIGCGSGSSCLPILRSSDSENTIILACDCSAVAVDVCNSVIESSKDVSKNFCAFVSDPSLERDETDTTFPQDVKAAHVQFLAEVNTNDEDIGLADVVLMVFVLSAVPPKRVARFMKQICDATKCGGKVCFRDYALYDLPMMRLNYVYSRCCDSDGKAPRLYERGDGTLSRFFNLDTVKEIFESAGFVAEELRYATVFNNNRKTGERLKRAFVHAVFRKPADRSVPIECF